MTKKSFFRSDCYERAERTYLRAVNGDEDTVWDYVAVTASSELQARRFEEEIRYRLERGLIPAKTKYLAVADPDGMRVGSGGACLNVLREIAKCEEQRGAETNELFEGLRILCIHSGGDSKRIPQYSVCGKLFAPIPRRLPDGLSATLFDEIMLTVSVFPEKMKEGMLTWSGDVLLMPGHSDYWGFECGAAAVSVRTAASVGCNHGVYLSDGKGFVRRFLHKQSAEVLKNSGAVGHDGCVDIDTGAVLFDSEILRKLYSLVDTDEKFRAAVNDRVRLSFYADFSYPLSKSATLADYLIEKPEGELTAELEKYRREIWNLLSKTDMRIIVLADSLFLHFGTTAELRLLMTDVLPECGIRNRERYINSNLLFTDYPKQNVTVNGGIIDKEASVGNGIYIEDSRIGKAVLGDGCVISSSVIPDGVTVPCDTVVSTVKTDAGYVARIYGVSDDPKAAFHFGRPIDGPLWSAPLFPVRGTPEEAVAATVDRFFGSGKADDGAILMSIEESVSRACGEGMRRAREVLFYEAAKNLLFGEAVEKRGLYGIEKLCEAMDDEAKNKLGAVLYDFIKEREGASSETEWGSMRMYAMLYRITRDREYLKAALDRLKNTVLAENGESIYGRVPVAEEKSVSLPVRINFGGGWTDTPPFCIERGGTVLNAAVTLDGKMPISATVRSISEKKLVLMCEESGEREEIYADNTPELLLKCQPSEPFAIHKAALYVSGLLDDGGDGRTVFDIIGGGLELYTAVRGIPKGSGLGTSSILAGALLSALYGLFGVAIDDNTLWNKILMMEQYMGTGGGWQDQVGGMTPGIKLITSEPGVWQNITVTPVGATEETLCELEDRLALIYTGQSREARGVLSEVVIGYLTDRHAAVSVLSSIADTPYFLKERLENGNVDGFGAVLKYGSELTEELYRGCFNERIRKIFRVLDPLICGEMLCGAGGGGYLQVIMNKGVTAEMLQTAISRVFGECEIKVQKCRFVRDLPH